MKLAIEEAKKSAEVLKCGAVIVKDNLVVASAHNSQHSDFDATAHAEMKAIREAGKRLQSKRLEGCTAYSTCEPCVMCLSAFAYARIDKIFFGVKLRDVYPLDKIIDVSTEEFLEHSPHKMEIVGEFMSEEFKKIAE